MQFCFPPLAAIVAINLAIGGLRHLPYPDPTQLRLPAEDAVQSGTLLTLGMRRLAADLAFVELLIYYGTDEPGATDESPVPTGTTHYPKIGALTRQIMNLDPFFTYAPLYGAGVLAFNLNRPEEALEILRTSAQRNPKEWKYRTYMAAIGAKQKGDSQKIIDELMPALRDPDCPTLIKHILAFLNRRLGHREEAIRIYRDILQSRDPSYIQIARDTLRQMGALAPGE